MSQKAKMDRFVSKGRKARPGQMRPKVDPSLQTLLDQYPAERSNLIPLLQVIQEKYGWLPTETLQTVADHLHLPPSVVYGVVTFYAQFYLTRQGKNRIRVCQGTACHVRGGKAIMDRVRRQLGINPGQTSSDYQFSLERVACLGSCALAPVMVVNDKVQGLMTTVKTDQILHQLTQANGRPKASKKRKKAAA